MSESSKLPLYRYLTWSLLWRKVKSGDSWDALLTAALFLGGAGLMFYEICADGCEINLANIFGLFLLLVLPAGIGLAALYAIYSDFKKELEAIRGDSLSPSPFSDIDEEERP